MDVRKNFEKVGVFAVRMKPLPKGSWNVFHVPAKGKSNVFMRKKGKMVAARAVLAPRSKSKKLEKAIADIVRNKHMHYFEKHEPVVIDVQFILPRPKSQIGKTGLRKNARKYPTVKPDVDKLTRALYDGLTGVLYDDDAQVVGGERYKLYDDDIEAGLYVKIYKKVD